MSKTVINLYSLLAFLLLICATAQAKQLPKETLKQLERMIKEGHHVFAEKDHKIVFHDDLSAKRVTFSEFFKDRPPVVDYEINVPKLLKKIKRLYKNGHTIFLNKKRVSFRIKEGKIVKSYKTVRVKIKKSARQKIIEQKKKFMKRRECNYCLTRLSLNYISMDNGQQLSPELGWVPLYPFSNSLEWLFPLSVASYLIENDKLKDQFDLGLKGQMFLRYYIGDFFVELGVGAHYFLYFTDTSFSQTVGMGYAFPTQFFIFTDKISFTGLFFNFSKILWRQDINEIKFGMEVSF